MHGHDAPLVKEGSVVTSGRFIRESDSSPTSQRGRAISDPKIRTLDGLQTWSPPGHSQDPRANGFLGR